MNSKMPGDSPLRLFFLIFTPIALLILGGSWYVGHDRIRHEMDLVQVSEINNVVLGVRRLDGELGLPLRHLRLLANTDDLRRAMNKTGPDAARRLQADFETLIAYHPNYDKVRWIDEAGRERIRVNNVRGHPVPASRDQLRDEGSSYYFTDTMALKPGDVFLSPLDLEAEHGKVDMPYKPMLRLATPVQDRNGRPRGILILNVSAQHLLDTFRESFGESRDHAMLVNRDGYWLSSPDPEDAWGFMFHRKETMATHYPDAWKTVTATPSGQVDAGDGLWTWSTAYPLKVEDSQNIQGIPEWLVISHFPANQLDLIRNGTWGSIAVFTLLLLAVSGALAARLAYALVGRTRAVVDAAKAHAEAQAAKQLAEADERFRLMVEANANGLLVADTEGRIVTANPALGRMFGYAVEELLGQPVEILVPDATKPRHGKLREGYIHAPEAKPMGAGRDLFGRRRDGSVFPVEVSLSPFTEHGKQYVDAVVADISARKQKEQPSG
jgi:PAS domain S-box-containing protein